MFLFCSVRRCVFLTACLICLIFSGCNPERRLAEQGDDGNVLAQYELAVYYSELDPPQKTKSYEWMKRAALSRYSPAMKKVAEYYLTGYGTPVNYPRAAEWLTRYFEKNRKSAEALEAGQKILVKAATRKDVIAGFILCNIALTLENQSGNPDSEIALFAANTISNCTKKIFYRLLENRNYADAEKIYQFAQKIYREYPNSFPAETQNALQQMNSTFFAQLNNN